jgi:hypothetical protein
VGRFQRKNVAYYNIYLKPRLVFSVICRPYTTASRLHSFSIDRGNLLDASVQELAVCDRSSPVIPISV